MQFEHNFYSVPIKLAGATLWLKAMAAMVTLYREHEAVASHVRAIGHGACRTVADHLPPAAAAWKLRDTQWCLAEAERIGPACFALVHALFGDAVLERLRAVQGILRVAHKHGAVRLEAACARANHYGTQTYRAVKTILDKGMDQQSIVAGFDALAATYTEGGRFCRDTSTMLQKGTPIMHPIPELIPHLKQLRLFGILDSLEARNREAIDRKLAYTEFLSLLIQNDVARRENKKLDLRLKRANFRGHKTFNRALVHDVLFATLTKVPLLIVDDFALKPLRPPEDEKFHDLIAERYERCTTNLTSNLDFAEWGAAFAANKMLGAATLDRLGQGAHRIVLDGESYRSPKAAERASAASKKSARS